MTSVTDDLRLAADFAPASYEDWRKLVDGVLKGAPFEKLVGKTYDGLKIEPIYPRAQNAAPIAGRPAAAPWQIMQRIDHPDAAIANAQALHDLENGATGLELEFAGGQGRAGFGSGCHRQKQWRGYLTASCSMPGSRLRSIRCSVARWPRFISPTYVSARASAPRLSISASALDRDHLAVRGLGLRPRGPKCARGHWRQSRGVAGPRFQGPVCAGRRPPGPRRRRIGSAGTCLCACGRRRLSARAGKRRRRARRSPDAGLRSSQRRCRSVPDHGEIPRAAVAVGAGRRKLRPGAATAVRCRRYRMANADAGATPM